MQAYERCCFCIWLLPRNKKRYTSSKLINHQELKEAAIKWFEENFTEKTTGKYGYVDHFNYYFVEIKILEGFDSKKLNCPARSEWKVVPNLYPSNRPFQVQEEMG